MRIPFPEITPISIFISNIPRTINFCQKGKILIRDILENEGVLTISHDGLPKVLHVEGINRTTEFLEFHHFTGFFYQRAYWRSVFAFQRVDLSWSMIHGT